MTESIQTFDQLVDQFIALYRQGDYTGALHFLEMNGPLFPQEEGQLMAWRSAMLSRLNRCTEAIKELEQAYAQGYWYHEGALTHDADFEPLQKDPVFLALVDQMAARRKAALPLSRPDLKVIQPAGTGPFPLLLALHGNYSSIRLTENYWQPAVERGWLLGVPQSSQLGWASGNAVWDNVDLSFAEVKDHLANIRAAYPANANTLVAGGFSMGAHIAVRMALDPEFNLRGVVAMEAWFNEEALKDLELWIAAAPPSQTRVVLFAGKENAEYMGMAQKINDLLTGHGMACKLVESSNPMHGYPPEFHQLLLQALDWIME